MSCRKRLKRHRNRAFLAARDEVQREPVYGLDGGRQIGGASLAQAFMWNMGTWRSDAKEETQGEEPARVRVPMRSAGTDQPVVVMKPGNATLDPRRRMRRRGAKSALRNAASVAAMMLCIEAIISEIPEPKSAPMGGPGGMGGMEDMY